MIIGKYPRLASDVTQREILDAGGPASRFLFERVNIRHLELAAILHDVTRHCGAVWEEPLIHSTDLVELS